MQVEDLRTPCLLIDMDILEQNIRTMSEYCAKKGVKLRPHVKAHKNPLIARKQLDAGAIGLTCQTLEETEAMIMNGLGPVLLTHILASDASIQKFLNLSKYGELMVSVDSLEAAELLGRAATRRHLEVDVLVEVNVGQNRTGVEPGEPAAKLASVITKLPGLKFKGMMGYEGHLQLHIPDFETRKKEDFISLERLVRSVEEAKKLGIEVEIVSGGGTGTYNIASEYPGITEIQPGSYVTMDHRYRQIKTAGSDFPSSLTILSTVVSTPDEKRAVVDLGWKGCGVEFQILGWDGMPKPPIDGVTYSLAGDEHGVLKCETPSLRPRFGEKLKFIPAHCDTALNLYGKFYGVRGDVVEIECPVARR